MTVYHTRSRKQRPGTEPKHDIAMQGSAHAAVSTPLHMHLLMCTHELPVVKRSACVCHV